MRRALLLVYLLAPGMSAQERPTEASIDTAVVVFGSDTVRAEVADTYRERVRGLQGRTELADGRGMLFVFDRPQEQSFWMVNTPLDLDIAFIDADFRVFKIATMTAGSDELVDSDGPASYALEVPAGWFARKGVEVGDRVEIVLPGG